LQDTHQFFKSMKKILLTIMLGLSLTLVSSVSDKTEAKYYNKLIQSNFTMTIIERGRFPIVVYCKNTHRTYVLNDLHRAYIFMNNKLKNGKKER